MTVMFLIRWFHNKDFKSKHTFLNRSLRGSQPLRMARPPTLCSPVRPTKSDITPPWLNPPTRIRFAGIPEAISFAITWFISFLEFSKPFVSSSFVIGSYEEMSNLEFERQNKMVSHLSWADQAGLSLFSLAVTGRMGLYITQILDTRVLCRYNKKTTHAWGKTHLTWASISSLCIILSSKPLSKFPRPYGTLSC